MSVSCIACNGRVAHVAAGTAPHCPHPTAPSERAAPHRASRRRSRPGNVDFQGTHADANAEGHYLLRGQGTLAGARGRTENLSSQVTYEVVVYDYVRQRLLPRTRRRAHTAWACAHAHAGPWQQAYVQLRLLPILVGRVVGVGRGRRRRSAPPP